MLFLRGCTRLWFRPRRRVRMPGADGVGVGAVACHDPEVVTADALATIRRHGPGYDSQTVLTATREAHSRSC
ncbi:MAG: hypothetical protein QOF30_3187 [Acidimicrobiaceae bacterium]|jgi:hypothetical protein|nr:hypothetical protein [Acidimicrobiaceae bacterium]